MWFNLSLKLTHTKKLHHKQGYHIRTCEDGAVFVCLVLCVCCSQGYPIMPQLSTMAGVKSQTTHKPITHERGKMVQFLCVWFLCVCCQQGYLIMPQLSTMAYDAITQGGIKSFGSPIYRCLWPSCIDWYNHAILCFVAQYQLAVVSYGAFILKYHQEVTGHS